MSDPEPDAHNENMHNDAKRHPTLAANETGHDYIVADLHGHRSRLDQALEDIGFDPTRDRLLSVGDLIDRGPESPECIALLNEPWFWAVRGNHEQMLIDAVKSKESMAWSRWLMNGGNWALEQNDDDLADWAEQIDALPFTLTVEHPKGRFGLCHAQYRLPHWEDRFKGVEEDEMDWIWGRSRLKRQETDPVAGIDWVFHGHTIVDDITLLGNSVFLDCGAFAGGPLVLTAVDDWLKR